MGIQTVQSWIRQIGTVAASIRFGYTGDSRHLLDGPVSLPRRPDTATSTSRCGRVDETVFPPVSIGAPIRLVLAAIEIFFVPHRPVMNHAPQRPSGGWAR